MKTRLMNLLASCGVVARFSELERIANELIDNGVTIIDTIDIKESLKNYQIIPIPDEKSFDYYKGFHDGITWRTK